MGAAILMSPTITVGQASYAAIESIGGLISLYPGSGSTGYGTITSVNIINTSGNTLSANLQLYFLGEEPAQAIADGTIVDFSLDLDKLAGMGILVVSSSSFVTVSIQDTDTYYGVTVPTQIGMYWEVKPNQDKPVIYMIMVADGVVTPGALDSNQFKVGVLMEFGKPPI